MSLAERSRGDYRDPINRASETLDSRAGPISIGARCPIQGAQRDDRDRVEQIGDDSARRDILEKLRGDKVCWISVTRKWYLLVTQAGRRDRIATLFSAIKLIQFIYSGRSRRTRARAAKETR